MPIFKFNCERCSKVFATSCDKYLAEVSWYCKGCGDWNIKETGITQEELEIIDQIEKEWQDESRTRTTVEHVYDTRIDCRIKAALRRAA